jgi:hypothetical protein
MHHPPSEEQAWEIARNHFGDDLASWVRLERTDFGWMARVEEPPLGPGTVIGADLLAIGPRAEDTRTYPPMSAPQLRRAHFAWLENVATASRMDSDGPASFS